MKEKKGETAPGDGFKDSYLAGQNFRWAPSDGFIAWIETNLSCNVH